MYFQLLQANIGSSNRFYPDLQHAVFGEHLTFDNKALDQLWSLLRGITLWNLWIAHNQYVFNRVRWQPEYVATLIWQGILDNGYTAWTHYHKVITMQPESSKKLLTWFDNQWNCFKLLCTHVNMHVIWQNVNPVTRVG
jgi:hypothetical protein